MMKPKPFSSFHRLTTPVLLPSGRGRLGIRGIIDGGSPPSSTGLGAWHLKQFCFHEKTIAPHAEQCQSPGFSPPPPPPPPMPPEPKLALMHPFQ